MSCLVITKGEGGSKSVPGVSQAEGHQHDHGHPQHCPLSCPCLEPPCPGSAVLRDSGCAHSPGPSCPDHSCRHSRPHPAALTTRWTLFNEGKNHGPHLIPQPHRIRYTADPHKHEDLSPGQSTQWLLGAQQPHKQMETQRGKGSCKVTQRIVNPRPKKEIPEESLPCVMSRIYNKCKNKKILEALPWSKKVIGPIREKDFLGRPCTQFVRQRPHG